MILYCGCSNHLGNTSAASYQDSRYGHGMRVHNPTKDTAWRCTVCEATKKGTEKVAK